MRTKIKTIKAPEEQAQKSSQELFHVETTSGQQEVDLISNLALLVVGGGFFRLHFARFSPFFSGFLQKDYTIKLHKHRPFPCLWGFSGTTKKGVTILLVEQMVQEALEIANRGYVIQVGRIVQSGSAQELLDSDEVRKAYMGM